MSRTAKLRRRGRALPDQQRDSSLGKKTGRSRRCLSARRALRRLVAEALEPRMLLTTVTSVNPAAHSLTAPVSTNIAATFDQNINPATATAQNFVVHSTQRGQLLSSSAAVSATGATVTLDPNTDFFPGELVQVSVTPAIQSAGGQGATARVWELRAAANGGTGAFIDTGQNLGAFDSEAGKLGDVDGDGDLDAVTGNWVEPNRVWINQGGAQSGTAGVFSDSGQAMGGGLTYQLDLGDVDGDGDLDIFFANRGNEFNEVWINQGGAQGGTPGVFSDSGQQLGGSPSVNVSLGDLDGDGDVDAFVVNRNGYSNQVWINQGGAQGGTTGTFGSNGQYLGTGNSYGVSLGDVDNDGDLDAFVANTGSSDRLWVNQGGTQGGTAGIFSDSGQSFGNFLGRGAKFGDFDNDGDLDVFVANNGQGNKVWINQGGAQGGTVGSFSDSGQSLGAFGVRSMEIGDVDGDGDLDAITAPANQLWLNQGGLQGGTAGQFSNAGLSLSNSGGRTVSFGDVDGDGDLDAYLANYAAGNRVWLGVGGNKAPTLDAISNVNINEDDPQQTVNLSGISAGTGETQPLKVTATSNDTSLVPHPTVTYTTPNATGTLTFTAVADSSGTATVTVTVEDGGTDGDLSTSNDNATSSRTFDVTVAAVNDIPTLDPLSSLTLNQGAPQQTVNLAGISAGGGESQPLMVTAVSDNTGLIPNPTVTYTTPAATGSLAFTPVASATGTATVTVTVEDGGLDNNLSTAGDNAKFDRLFVVTVNAGSTAVTGVVFNGGSANRSGIANLTFQFDEATTVDSAGSLILWNHTTGAAVDVSGASLSGNGTTAVIWNLSGIALPEGNYTATLPKSAANLAVTHTQSFHVWPGDSNGDGSVGFADFGDLANNFNLSGGPLYGPGDLDGDGNVGFSDFSVLATNFNRTLAALSLDFGDALESGTAFPTTLAKDGARHVLGSLLTLGATVDAEADGQPDANAVGDGADEDGVTFATLTAGTNAAVTVNATVGGTALLNAWFDFNIDGDWDDAGEHVLVDQALNNGANNLTVSVPAGAAAGPAMARFRVSSVAGYAYYGLARDGEVEDYQVTLVAARSSAGRAGAASSASVWAAVLADSRQAAGPSGLQPAAPEPSSIEPTRSQVVDIAFGQLAAARQPAAPSRETAAPVDHQLVDQVLGEETDLLPSAADGTD